MEIFGASLELTSPFLNEKFEQCNKSLMGLHVNDNKNKFSSMQRL